MISIARASKRRWLIVAGWLAASIVAGLLLDQPAYRFYRNMAQDNPDGVEGIRRSLAACRITGVEQFALLAGLLLWRCHRRGWRAMLVYWLAALLAAATGAVVGRCIGRLRPEVGDGKYVFVHPPASFHWRQQYTFACPSGHATGSFTSMLMLRHFVPRGGPVFMMVGVGCGLERIATLAHFVSDVVVAFWVAWFISRFAIYLERRWWGGRQSSQRGMLGPSFR